MNTLDIILIVGMYIIMGLLVGGKQYEAGKKQDEYEETVVGVLAGIFWPIFLVIYLARCTFFRPWGR